MGGLDERRPVADRTARARVLHQDAGDIAVGNRIGGQVDDLDRHAGRLGPGLDHGDGLRVDVGVDDEAAAALDHAVAQGHGLGRGGALVEQRGVGHRQTGEILDHGLEVEERLEPALRDLRLVGRVRRVPARVLEHVAQDHRGSDGPEVAEPDHRRHGAVGRGQLPQLGQGLGLGRGLGQIEDGLVGDRGGHGGRGQLVERAEADRGEHLGDLVLGRPDVAVDEPIRALQVRQRGTVGHEAREATSGQTRRTHAPLFGAECVENASAVRPGAGGRVVARAAPVRRPAGHARGQGTHQEVRRLPRRRRDRLRRGPGRVLRVPRPQRRGQDVDDADDRLRVADHQRQAPGARARPGERRAGDPGPARRRPPGGHARDREHGVREHDHLRPLLQPAPAGDPRAGRRAARVRAARRASRRQGRAAVRRA